MRQNCRFEFPAGGAAKLLLERLPTVTSFTPASRPRGCKRSSAPAERRVFRRLELLHAGLIRSNTIEGMRLSDLPNEARLMRTATAPCVGGPFDGMDHEINSAEFPVTTVGSTPGGRSRSGVYRYDEEESVYRWFATSDLHTRSDAEQFDREADAAVYDGDLRGAKAKYGWAIDAYLDLEDFESAVKTCRKIIRLAPEVARARFTLAFLLIGQGQLDEARMELVRYADAVRATEVEDFAIPRLQLLAHATGEATTRSLIETLITDLGGTIVPRIELTGSFDAAARWARVLDTVLRDSLK